MNVNRFERFLLWFSKTDIEALAFCTNETRMTQISIAIMVICTGVFAFFSSFFAIHSNFQSYIGATLVAIIYSITIISFDREIVGATDKSGLIVRVPCALLIALVISYPLEMKLLDGKIQKHMEDALRAEVGSRLTKEKSKQAVIASDMAVASGKAFDSDEKRIESLNKKIGQIRIPSPPSADADDQAKNARWQAIRKAKAEKARLEKERETLQSTQSQHGEEVRDSLKEQKEASRQQEAKEAVIEQEVAKRLKGQQDFLSKSVALSEITGKNSQAFWMTIVLKLFFVMLELFPTVLKFLMPRNEYMAYRDARRLLSVNKIHHYHNILQDKIKAETEPENLVTLYREITDQMETLVEDNPNHRIAAVPRDDTPAL